MITSDRQLQATQKKLNDLKASLDNGISEVPVKFQGAFKAQRLELVAELEAEIEEYKRLKSNHVTSIAIESMDDIKLAPIRFRLAKNMTVEQFAMLVGVHSRQIARYEEKQYENITVEVLTKILSKIRPRISGELSIER